jgi:glycolate oxidase FAD binding subunit
MVSNGPVGRQVTLQIDLEPIVGSPNMRPAGGFIVDGLMPRAAVAPPTPEAAAEVIRYANSHQVAIIPQGGRGHIALGNIPASYDIALSMTGLNTIVDYEPEDLTITCQAGITLGALRKATAASGQMVPFDPEIPDSATVGGVLAADVWGPARMSLGAPRDFTIGLRVITGDGLITRAGGRVVKNVAGYDLCKLYIGSLGTLAVITEATFKTLPLPKSTDRLTFSFVSAEAACWIPNEGVMRGLTLRSAVVSREDGRWLLDLQLTGSPAAVKRSMDELRTLAAEAGGKEAPRPGKQQPAAVTALVPSLPSRLRALLESLPDEVSIAAYPTLGVVRIGSEDIPDLDAPFIIESCGPEQKADRDVFGAAPVSLPLMQAMKARLDPDNILSPGRFSGGL